MQHNTAAYVMDRPNLIFRDDDASRLTQLNFSFALIKDGVVSGSHWQSIDAYKAYIAKHPHILPVVSVGGWGADGFSQASATEEGRRRFVKSTLQLMEAHGFRGVDIDWEYPGSSIGGIASSSDDRQHFTALLLALRQGLSALTSMDGKPRLLAAALGASSELIKNIEAPAVGALLDQVNLMTYDMYTSGVCSHHTALYSSNPDYPLCGDLAVNAYRTTGIPPHKIMLGCAMYGRVFRFDNGHRSPLFSPSSSNGSDTLRYHDIRSDPAFTLGFDPLAKAAYAFDQNRFVTYDSVVSIAEKREYVSTNGLMGLMCWEYSGDNQGELLKAMHGESL